jgi:hypothetical protein
MVKMDKIFLLNEKLYFAKGLKILLQQIIHDATQIKRGEKLVQFALIFHLYIHGPS